MTPIAGVDCVDVLLAAVHGEPLQPTRRRIKMAIKQMPTYVAQRSVIAYSPPPMHPTRDLTPLELNCFPLYKHDPERQPDETELDYDYRMHQAAHARSHIIAIPMPRGNMLQH